MLAKAWPYRTKIRKKQKAVKYFVLILGKKSSSAICSGAVSNVAKPIFRIFCFFAKYLDPNVSICACFSVATSFVLSKLSKYRAISLLERLLLFLIHKKSWIEL